MSSKSSKSSSNATRFTATSPTAHSRSSLSRSLPSRKAQETTSQGTSSTPPGSGKTNTSSSGETPAQKVARLRREHEARKLAKFSLWEKIVLRGRVVADTAHRMTVFGLMGFSAVTGVIAVYSLTNMIILNRRKRKQWLKDQTEIYQIKLYTAIQNARQGIATDDDILVINQERAIRVAEEAKRNKQTVWSRARGMFLYGLGDKPDERIRKQMEAETLSPLEQLDRDVEVQMSASKNEEPSLSVSTQAAGTKSAVVAALQEGQRKGGELDRLGESVSRSAKEGWGRWFGGRSRTEIHDREGEARTS